MALDTTATNAQFDARLAAVPAPFGPLTRVGTDTDLDTAPTYDPNIYMEFHVKTALGGDMHISYVQLANTMVTNQKARAAHGQYTAMWDMVSLMTALGNIKNGMTDAELFALGFNFWRKIMLAFGAIPYLDAIIPFNRFTEVEGVKLMKADFSYVDSGGQLATFTDLSENEEYATWSMFIAGDGKPASFMEGLPASYDYGSAGTYNATLILINHSQGVVYKELAITVA